MLLRVLYVIYDMVINIYLNNIVIVLLNRYNTWYHGLHDVDGDSSSENATY